MKRIFLTLTLCILLLLTASVVLYIESESKEEIVTLLGEPYRELKEPGAFIHSNPFTLTSYVGEKIILLEFMSYTCANCQRSFPHLVSLNERYAESGLLVVGVHTPRFLFEESVENVTAALGAAGITFPVVLDNAYATWDAYGNHYWPRILIIDLSGTIIYDHVGIPDFAEVEDILKQLLSR